VGIGRLFLNRPNIISSPQYGRGASAQPCRPRRRWEELLWPAAGSPPRTTCRAQPPVFLKGRAPGPWTERLRFEAICQAVARLPASTGIVVSNTTIQTRAPTVWFSDKTRRGTGGPIPAKPLDGAPHPNPVSRCAGSARASQRRGHLPADRGFGGPSASGADAYAKIRARSGMRCRSYYSALGLPMGRAWSNRITKARPGPGCLPGFDGFAHGHARGGRPGLGAIHLPNAATLKLTENPWAGRRLLQPAARRSRRRRPEPAERAATRAAAPSVLWPGRLSRSALLIHHQSDPWSFSFRRALLIPVFRQLASFRGAGW